MTSYKFVTYIIVAIIVALTSTNVISNPVYGIIALVVYIFNLADLLYFALETNDEEVKSMFFKDAYNLKKLWKN